MENRLIQIAKFDWNRSNIDKIREKHNVEPHECEETFFNELFISTDESHSHAEQRYHALGITNSDRLLFIVFTIRAKKIRVISARDVNKKERRIYYEKIKENTQI